MPEQVLQTSVNTFVKGLITEASPLTYPKDSSVDELNCELERTGVRRRREGIIYEEDFEFSSFTTTEGQLVHTQRWENVANTAGSEFLVLQVGSTLYFYDKGAAPPSSGEQSFSVDLNLFNASTGLNVYDTRISAASIRGNLVVTSAAIEPFYIEFDPDTSTISTVKIVPKVRDFDWQGNRDEYFSREPIGSATQERIYDTINCGWVSAVPDYPVLDHYKSSRGAYPPLNQQWWNGRDQTGSGTGDFRANWFEKNYGGTSLIGNGHFILDLFLKDRAQALVDDPEVFETISLPQELEPTRFTSTARYAGRIWFAGLNSRQNSSSLFFSAVIQSMQDVEKFYQEGDPTSEFTPDLIDSDGGVIVIPSMSRVRALFEWGDSLLVFAENGVWEVTAPDGVFSASSFSVTRVTGAEGLNNPATLIDAEGQPFWWSRTGIYTVSREDVSQRAIGQDLSKATIQTFWEEIGEDRRLRATGTYDPSDKRIYWIYEKSDETIDYKYNRVLILDLFLQAFIPWEFCDEATNTDYVVNIEYYGGIRTVGGTDTVIIGGDFGPAFANVLYLDAHNNNTEISRTCGGTTYEDTLHEWNLGIDTSLSNAGGLGNDSSNTLFGENTTAVDTGVNGWGPRGISCEDGRDADNVFHFVSGDFVIEGWVYHDDIAIGSNNAIVTCFNNAQFSDRNVWQMQIQGDAFSNKLVFSFYPSNVSGSPATSILGPSIPKAQWVHVAVQRNGDDHTCFVNGVPGTTVTTSDRPEGTAIQELNFGESNDAVSSTDFWVGNIGDFRISEEAFYPETGFTPPSGPFPRSGGGGGDIVEADGEEVVVTSDVVEAASEGIKFLVRDGVETKLTVAETTNRSFLDWEDCSYESYAETIFDFGGDLTTRKNNIFVTCYFEKTETGFEVDETTFLNPSSCFLEAYWDTGTNISSRQQVYRLRKTVTANSADLSEFDYPFESVISRNKVRGRGRCLQLRFESETQKDFRLEGYEVLNAKPG